MVTHESFRLSWTPDVATDQIEFQRTGGDWTALTATGNDDSPFTVTVDSTRFSGATIIRLRTTPINFRIRDFKADEFDSAGDEFSNVVTVTLKMPDGTGGSVTGNPPAMSGGDETEMPTTAAPGSDATDKAVLPSIIRGITNGIFDRIQQRQRRDGRWK